MLESTIGSNPKIGRFSDAEFRCLITGVWALASEAEPRGSLLIGDAPAEPRDIAHKAHVSTGVARKTLEKMRALKMLELGEGGVERVHDWDSHQPKPRSNDPTNAERQRRYRDRHNATVTATVTPVSNGRSNGGNADEVEVEEKTPQPPEGEQEKATPEIRRLCDLLAGEILRRDSKAKVAPDSTRWLRDMRLLVDDRGGDHSEVEAVLRWSQADAFWQQNILSPGKLRAQFTQLKQRAGTGVPNGSSSWDRRMARIEQAQAEGRL